MQYQQLKTYNRNQLNYQLIENQYIKLNDGTKIAVKMWLPTKDILSQQTVPAILEYLPYRKGDGTIYRDEITHPILASKGYICVRADIRGNGESDGLMHDEYTQQELEDGVEIINYIANMKECNQNVAIMGISWGGFNALQIAYLQPKYLKGIITLCSTDDRYNTDIHYQGGSLLNDNLTWSQQMLCYSSYPPDSLIRADWKQIWRHRLENLPFLAHNWLKHQQRDDFWKHGSICEDFSKINIPILAISGWNDGYPDSIQRIFNGIRNKNLFRGIVGPWEHSYPNIAKIEPRIDFISEVDDFLKEILKNKQQGLDYDLKHPTFRIFLVDSHKPSPSYERKKGNFIELDKFPSDDCKNLQLNLSSLNMPYNEGNQQNQIVQVPNSYFIGQKLGNFCPGMRIDNELPQNQVEDDGKSLCFQFQGFSSEINIIGTIKAFITFKSSMPVAQMGIRICDHFFEDNQEYSTLITHRAVNLNAYNSQEKCQQLEKNTFYQIQVDLKDIAYKVPQGHSIRISISSSLWPLVWPTPELPDISIDLKQSYIQIPHIETQDLKLYHFKNYDIQKPQSQAIFEEVTQSSNFVEKKQKNGVLTIKAYDDFGISYIQNIKVNLREKMETDYYIEENSPLSARIESRCEGFLGREGWKIKTFTKSSMTSDKEHFYIGQEVKALYNDEIFFEKQWKEKILRSLM